MPGSIVIHSAKIVGSILFSLLALTNGQQCESAILEQNSTTKLHVTDTESQTASSMTSSNHLKQNNIKLDESVHVSREGRKPESLPPETYALSVTYLTYLARVEMDIYKELENYANVLEKRLKLIKDYMKDYEGSTRKVTDQMDPNIDPWTVANHIATHPLIAYRTVRRFSHEFRAVTENIGQNFEEKLDDFITNLAGESGWPSKNDNEDGMEAILRLHYTYELNLEEFTNGKVADVFTDVGLPTHQIFEIAQFAIENEYYSLALDWLRSAESGIRRENDTGISILEIANAYKRIMDLHDKNFKNMTDDNHPYIFNAPLNGSLDNAMSLREIGMKMLADTKPPLLNEGTKTEDDNEEDVSPDVSRKALHYTLLGLCNGENYQTEEYKSLLKCWHDSSRSPYFSHINPLKVELLNIDPLLLQIYDVIGDTGINKLIDKALPDLERAPQSNGTYRTASYAWLSDEDLEDSPILRRIELITNLIVRGSLASEWLQVASYAYGGHVEPHLDSLEYTPDMPEFYTTGDRVTTFLIYLNEVQRGGYTAFPKLKTHVKPVTGSAVLWYTSLKNGDIDSRLRHAACPVILGHKWIATKWTHLNENFLKRPCDLDLNL